MILVSNPNPSRNVHQLFARKVKNLEIISRLRVSSFLQGNRSSLFHGLGTDFADLREYEPGDDLRRIDWNATARKAGELVVKEFYVERNANVLGVLDVSQSMLLGETNPRVKKAVEALAALGFAANMNKDLFGLATFGQNINLYIPPKAGKKHLYYVFSRLLGVIPEGSTKIGDSIKDIIFSLKKRSIILVVTDLHANIEETFYGFKVAKAYGHDIQVIHISDPLEYVFPKRIGKVKFNDPENGETLVVDLEDPIMKGNYYFKLMKRINALHEFMKKLRGMGVRVIETTTQDVTEKVLLAYFNSKRKGAVLR